jgi:hypothetical protein
MIRHSYRMRRLIIGMVVIAGLGLSLACSKKLPSSPAQSAGTPVIMTGEPRQTMSGTVAYEKGEVYNQSGITIYRFRVAMVVWQGDPINAAVTDTSEVKIATLATGVKQPFAAYELMGSRFIDAYPVYDILP